MLFTCTDGVRSAEMVTPKSRQEVTNGRRVPSIKFYHIMSILREVLR